jgi:hypothetical protein
MQHKVQQLKIVMSLLLTTASMASAQQTPSTTMQKTSGWCTPHIANVTGSVEVICVGVDPRALKRLNSELAGRKLQLTDKIRQADEWARRYHELETQLSEAGADSALFVQAKMYRSFR